MSACYIYLRLDPKPDVASCKGRFRFIVEVAVPYLNKKFTCGFLLKREREREIEACNYEILFYLQIIENEF